MSSHDRDQYDKLAPRDLAITLRSVPRRFAAVQSRAGAPRLADVIGRTGPSGARLDDLLAGASRGAALVGNALDTALTTNDPVVAHAVLDPTERVYTDDRVMRFELAVDTISTEADGAAQRIEHATADDLSREVSVTGGGTTTPLAIGQQLARELIGALNSAERHVEWLESQA